MFNFLHFASGYLFGHTFTWIYVYYPAEHKTRFSSLTRDKRHAKVSWQAGADNSRLIKILRLQVWLLLQTSTLQACGQHTLYLPKTTPQPGYLQKCSMWKIADRTQQGEAEKKLKRLNVGCYDFPPSWKTQNRPINTESFVKHGISWNWLLLDWDYVLWRKKDVYLRRTFLGEC